MHEFIKSPTDVLAVKYKGTITGKDLDAALDKLETMLTQPGKVHFFIEMRGIESLELSALPHHFSRSFPLFSKIGRFGRVAVVADQAWMRVLTRFESAAAACQLPRVRAGGARGSARMGVRQGAGPRLRGLTALRRRRSAPDRRPGPFGAQKRLSYSRPSVS